MSDAPHALVELHEHTLVVTMNRPEKRNALSGEMLAIMSQAWDRVNEDDDVRVCILTGAGGSFCAGADLSHLGASQREGLLAIYEGFLRVARCPLPTIAAVNGPAVGAGMNLALAADVRLAGTSARFDTRFLQLGIHPGGGHTWMLRRIVGPQVASAMVLFGEVLSGPEAAECGLAWRCVEDDDLIDAAMTLARRAAAAPPELVRRTKATIAAVATIDDHPSAVERELVDQAWSVSQPAFAQRLAAMAAKISKAPGR